MDELEQLEQAINRDDVAEVARLRGGGPEDIRAVIAQCIDDGAVMTPLTLRKVLGELDAARARVAALEAVAEAACAALDVDPTSRAGAEAHIRLEAALDAASAAGTASGRPDR